MNPIQLGIREAVCIRSAISCCSAGDGQQMSLFANVETSRITL